jgi:hypothetical protein
MTTEQIATECARVAYDMSLDTARAALTHPPGKERSSALRRLARSTSLVDRYAAQTARRWEREP